MHGEKLVISKMQVSYDIFLETISSFYKSDENYDKTAAVP